MTLETGHILLVDDDPDVLAAGQMVLKRTVGRVSVCGQPDEIPALMDSDPPDVILLDMNFGPGRSDGREGLDWIARIRTLDPNTVVIPVTAHGGVQVAVEAMKRGATDFVTKPWNNDKLTATVSTALELARTRRTAEVHRTRAEALAADSARAEQPLIGRSAPMQSVLSLIERAAPTEANVLILGENGTGKELVARAIHRASARAAGVFLSVDLGAIPENLFESELFGHRKGAFTDAKADRTGRLEAASGGTLFLDEIGNLPLHLQAKLLTALERRTVTPVGGRETVPFDVRVLAATNLPSDKLVDPELFRPDLLFRLNTVEIDLPPLRERREDIPELVRHYLALYQRRYHKPEKSIEDEAMAALTGYDWPGNVRALRHAVERAVILCEGDAYTAEDFSLPATARAAAAREQVTGAKEETLNLAELERTAVERALRKHRFNISHAARELGLTRAALYRRMEKHGL